MKPNPETVLSRIERAGIVESASKKTRLSLTESFESKIEEYSSGCEVEDIFERLVGRFEESSTMNIPYNPENSRHNYLHVYAALEEYLPDIKTEQRIQLATILNVFRGSRPRDEGTPEPFLSVDGHMLPSLLGGHQLAIVYIWLEDCDPCDMMQKNIEQALEGSSRDLGLFSVYGPSCTRFMFERYNVRGGPTTLFILDGQVNVRLTGVQSPLVVRKEVRKLRNLG